MRLPHVVLPISLCIMALLTGCGIGPVTTQTSGTLSLNGIVHGGQQPVSGSQVYMFRAGTGGNGTAAISMLKSPGYVLTNNNGAFTLTGDYSCNSSSDQVYVVAVGGNPGLASGTNNAALIMADLLGSCGNLTATTNIYINEITTVAAAYVLAPFSTSYSNVASSSTNKAGIANAFLDFKLLVDPATGQPPLSLPSNLTAPTATLMTLASALAGCVNSDGTMGCNPLFSATTVSQVAPSTTWNAALNIARNPAANVSGVYSVIPGSPVYPRGLTAPPYDWALPITITGGGLNGPTSMDIDANGNVWVADYYGALSEFSPQGTPLSGVSGFGVGIINEAYGMTIDTDGYVWVANEESNPNPHGSVSKFYGSSSGLAGTVILGNGGSNFYDGSIDYPVSLSADTNGDFFIANYANSSATAYSDAGSPVATYLGTNLGTGNNSAFPVAVAADASHGVWIANLGDTTISHISSNGTLLAHPTCCDGANGIATDAQGNAWVANYYGNSFSLVSSAGATLINNGPIVTSGMNSSYPAGISVDAGQNVWIANYRGESISELSGYNSATPGAMLSNGYGFGYSGTSTGNPLLLLPYAIVPDASGNIWVSNFGNNNLVLFLGIATPTAMPIQPTPVAP